MQDSRKHGSLCPASVVETDLFSIFENRLRPVPRRPSRPCAPRSSPTSTRNPQPVKERRGGKNNENHTTRRSFAHERSHHAHHEQFKSPLGRATDPFFVRLPSQVPSSHTTQSRRLPVGATCSGPSPPLRQLPGLATAKSHRGQGATRGLHLISGARPPARPTVTGCSANLEGSSTGLAQLDAAVTFKPFVGLGAAPSSIKLSGSCSTASSPRHRQPCCRRNPVSPPPHPTPGSAASCLSQPRRPSSTPSTPSTPSPDPHGSVLTTTHPHYPLFRSSQRKTRTMPFESIVFTPVVVSALSTGLIVCEKSAPGPLV